MVLLHMVHPTFKPFAIKTSFHLTLGELETLWLVVHPTVYRWSLICTSHIDMTAHTAAFLLCWVPLMGKHGVHILPKDVT